MINRGKNLADFDLNDDIDAGNCGKREKSPISKFRRRDTRKRNLIAPSGCLAD
jgi:hypothetical protein